MIRFALTLLSFVLLLPSPAAASERLIVFAAASLQGALEEIVGPRDGAVRLSFGGSGTMARQIAAGAPADAVILASPDWMDWLAASGTPLAAPPQALLANSLVVIGPQGAERLTDPGDILRRLGDGRLAMGHRDAVPAGVYARQWLEGLDLWTPLAARLAEADNVRAALAYVARGAAPLGIVYASDARAAPAVSVLWEVDPQGHAPIRYLAAALSPAGLAFLSDLRTPAAATIFDRHGFRPVPE